MLENFLVSKRSLRISFFGGKFGDYLPKGVKYEKKIKNRWYRALNYFNENMCLFDFSLTETNIKNKNSECLKAKTLLYLSNHRFTKELNNLRVKIS